MKRTKDVLFIYWWNSKEKGHEETQGFNMFAATLHSDIIDLVQKDIDSFITSCKYVDNYSFMQVNSDDDPLNVLKVQIKFKDNLAKFGAEWNYLKFLNDLLSLCLKLKFDVAWVGVDYETDYSDLFYEGQTIYAAASQKLGVIITSDWNDELKLVDSKTIAKLRQEAINLKKGNRK